jgi:predicted dehydrogenase
MLRPIVASFVVSIIFATVAAADEAKPIHVGMIGIDTSHAPAFTKHMNDPKATDARAGVTVVAAYVGGCDDVPESVKFRPKCVKQMREMGVEIVPTIEELLDKVDAVMIQTLHGRPHLEEAKKVVAAGKPFYIDKPLAGSLEDCVEIYDTAKRAGVKWFSASSLRFAKGVAAIGNGENKAVGKVVGCDAWGPNHPLEPKTMPDLFYYGIHGTEILFTIMGPGCKTVTRVHGDGGNMPSGTDVVVGVWEDGRVGTYRSAAGFGAMVFGANKAVVPSGGWTGYDPLVVEIAKFFRTGKTPMSPEEVLEVYAFLAAADASKAKGGCPVAIKAVLDDARRVVAARQAR